MAYEFNIYSTSLYIEMQENKFSNVFIIITNNNRNTKLNLRCKQIEF